MIYRFKSKRIVAKTYDKFLIRKDIGVIGYDNIRKKPFAIDTQCKKTIGIINLLEETYKIHREEDFDSIDEVERETFIPNNGNEKIINAFLTKVIEINIIYKRSKLFTNTSKIFRLSIGKKCDNSVKFYYFYNNLLNDSFILNSISKVSQLDKAHEETGRVVFENIIGRKKLLLSPEVSSAIFHECVGHLVEQDALNRYNPLLKLLGKRVCTDQLSFLDDGNNVNGGIVQLSIDEEGIKNNGTYLIKNGILNSFLVDEHDSQKIGLKPSGNLRSEKYSDLPMIRMTNTKIICENEKNYSEPLKTLKNGIYLKESIKFGDSFDNGDFQLYIEGVFSVQNGGIINKVQPLLFSGNVIDFLASIRDVINSSALDYWSSICGKNGQNMLVSSRGPYLIVEHQF